MILAQLISISALIVLTLADVVVNPITGITSKNLMFTGTIGVDTSKLFFTYYGFDGETDAEKLNSKPLIIAVGSPGRSAQYINLGGIGPKILKNDMSLADNPNSLTSIANVMFLDSLGAGFSFTDKIDSIPSDTKSYGIALSTAINNFIK